MTFLIRPSRSRARAASAVVLAALAPALVAAALQNPPPAQPPTSPTSAATPQANQTPAGPPDPQQPIFKARIELVRVDVSVIGRDDEPVTDLKLEDFEVAEDGVPQKIEQVDFVKLDGQVPPDYKEALEIRSMTHAKDQAAREDVRLFVIFLDDYHVDKRPHITLPLRRALEAFVKQFAPMDLIAVMDPLTPLSHLKFTRARDELVQRMHEFEGRRGELFPVKSAAEEAQLKERNIFELRAGVTLSALDAVVTHLGGLREGRKSVLFVSQGPPIGGPSSTNFPRLQDVVKNANRGNVTIHVLDPRPLGMAAFGGSLSLRMMTDETGGRAIMNTNDPSDGLKGVISDASAYYLVGYAPTRPITNDGRFHKIEVKLKRRGVRVMARQGYWSPSEEEVNPRVVKLPPPKEVVTALSDLVAPVDGRDIDIWVGATRAPNGMTRLAVTWDPTNRYGHTGPVRLEVEPLDAEGVNPVAPAQTIAMTKTPDMAAVARFDLKPGAVVLRLTARNAAGGVVDKWPERVRVPALTADLALATPRFLRARSPFELRALESDPDPTPAASRRLRTTDRVVVELECYSAGAGPVELSAELLNREGKTLVTFPIPAAVDGKSRFTLPVSSLARSTYLLRIQARNGDKWVQQLAPFQIVP